MAKNKFGVHVWKGVNDDMLDLAANNLGVGWIRIGNGGVWQWRKDPAYMTQIEQLCERIRVRGMEPHITFPLHVGTDALPSDMDSIADFIAERVSTLQLEQTTICPEPHGFSGVFTAEECVELYRRAYPKIKAVKPDCVVLGSWGWGAMHQIYNSSDYALDKLVKLGLLNYIDGLSIHPYSSNTPPEDKLPSEYADLKTYLVSVGAADYPLYFDEWGVTLEYEVAGGGPRTEAEQADLVGRILKILDAIPNTKMIIYFYLYYTSGNWSKCGGNLVRQDGSKRPAYNVYKDYIASGIVSPIPPPIPLWKMGIGVASVLGTGAGALVLYKPKRRG